MLSETDINEPTVFVIKNNRRITKKFDPTNVYKYLFNNTSNEIFIPVRV
jgi:hypothetical protein